MIVRRYAVTCPSCHKGSVTVQDRPSVASINNYLPPDARQPVPPGDKWGFTVCEDCPACGLSRTDLGSILERDGLPPDHREIR